MANNASTPFEKKSFREAFFAEAVRKDPNKKTIWELIVGPTLVVVILFTAIVLVIAGVAFTGWIVGGQGGASAATTVAGTVVQNFLA